MTHYQISYQGLTPNEQHAKAIDDIIDYMGVRKYNEIIEDCRQHSQISLDGWYNIIAFAGLQGYPARVMYYEIWPFG